MAGDTSHSLQTRLPALDGLRGIALLLVLLDHASDADMRFFAEADLNRAGKFGVYLFFVLSAFLLTHLFLMRPASELRAAKTWLNYFLRRFLRIFPLYAIVLISLFFMHQVEVSDIINHLLLRAGDKQYWSIPVEVKYYLILPGILVASSFIRQRKWRSALLASLGAAATCWLLFQLEQEWSLSKSISLVQNIFPFVIGSVAALLHGVLDRRPAVVSRLAWFLEISAMIALAASLVRIPFIFHVLFTPDQPIRKLSHDPYVCGVLWTALLIGLLHGKGFVRRFMEWLPLRYLGLISFSAYLWHEKFLSDVDDLPVPTQLRLVVFLLIVVVVASASYFLIERPLSRIRLKANRVEAGPPSLPSPLSRADS